MGKMIERADLHQQFVKRFHSGKRLRPATDRQLTEVERKLVMLWPVAYCQFALAHGAVYSPAILDLILERKASFADVQQFLTLRQSMIQTKSWGLDADGGTVAFAHDCSGNLFAFRRLPADGQRSEDAPVWLLDHETGQWVKQAKTFDQWLDKSLRLKPLTSEIPDSQKSRTGKSLAVETGIEHRFQVVVQFPDVFFKSPEEIHTFGENLAQSMPRTHDYDGFDAGSGTVNYFLYSNTPTAVLANFRKYLGTNKVEKKVRIAFRELASEEFINLWPKRDDRPFDYSY